MAARPTKRVSAIVPENQRTKYVGDSYVQNATAVPSETVHYFKTSHVRRPPPKRGEQTTDDQPTNETRTEIGSRISSSSAGRSTESRSQNAKMLALHGNIEELKVLLQKHPSLLNKRFVIPKEALLTEDEKSDEFYVPPPQVPKTIRLALHADRSRRLSLDHRWSLAHSFSNSTLLHFASAGDQYEMVEFLLKNGADRSILNDAGKTADFYTMDQRIKKMLWETNTVQQQSALGLSASLDSESNKQIKLNSNNNIKSADGTVKSASTRTSQQQQPQHQHREQQQQHLQRKSKEISSASASGTDTVPTETSTGASATAAAFSASHKKPSTGQGLSATAAAALFPTTQNRQPSLVSKLMDDARRKSAQERGEGERKESTDRAQEKEKGNQGKTVAAVGNTRSSQQSSKNTEAATATATATTTTTTTTTTTIQATPTTKTTTTTAENKTRKSSSTARRLSRVMQSRRHQEQEQEQQQQQQGGSSDTINSNGRTPPSVSFSPSPTYTISPSSSPSPSSPLPPQLGSPGEDMSTAFSNIQTMYPNLIGDENCLTKEVWEEQHKVLGGGAAAGGGGGRGGAGGASSSRKVAITDVGLVSKVNANMFSAVDTEGMKQAAEFLAKAKHAEKEEERELQKRQNMVSMYKKLTPLDTVGGLSGMSASAGVDQFGNLLSLMDVLFYHENVEQQEAEARYLNDSTNNSVSSLSPSKGGFVPSRGTFSKKDSPSYSFREMIWRRAASSINSAAGDTRISEYEKIRKDAHRHGLKLLKKEFKNLADSDRWDGLDVTKHIFEEYEATRDRSVNGSVDLANNNNNNNSSSNITARSDINSGSGSGSSTGVVSTAGHVNRNEWCLSKEEQEVLRESNAKGGSAVELRSSLKRASTYGKTPSPSAAATTTTTPAAAVPAQGLLPQPSSESAFAGTSSSQSVSRSSKRVSIMLPGEEPQSQSTSNDHAADALADQLGRLISNDGQNQQEDEPATTSFVTATNTISPPSRPPPHPSAAASAGTRVAPGTLKTVQRTTTTITPPSRPPPSPSPAVYASTCTGTASSTTIDMNDEKLQKYVKLKQMLPEGVVRQKMMVDGYSQEFIDSFVSGSNSGEDSSSAQPQPQPQAISSSITPATTPAPPKVPPGAPPPPRPPPSASSSPVVVAPPPPGAPPAANTSTSSSVGGEVVDEKLEKYIKLKRMLPEGVVRQKMMVDGYSDAFIDAFVAGTPLPPC